MPRHGEQRNQRRETTCGPPRTFLDATTGEPVYSGSTVAVTQPASERYCGACDRWHPQHGILSAILGCPACGRDW